MNKKLSHYMNGFDNLLKSSKTITSEIKKDEGDKIEASSTDSGERKRSGKLKDYDKKFIGFIRSISSKYGIYFGNDKEGKVFDYFNWGEMPDLILCLQRKILLDTGKNMDEADFKKLRGFLNSSVKAMNKGSNKNGILIKSKKRSLKHYSNTWDKLLKSSKK